MNSIRRFATPVALIPGIGFFAFYHLWTPFGLQSVFLAMTLFTTFKQNGKSSDQTLSKFANGFVNVLEHARDLYASSESLRKYVNEESHAVSKSSSALDEISAMLTKTADGAKKLDTMSTEAKVTVESGKKAISELIQGLTVIDQGTTRLNTNLDSNLKSLSTVIQALSEIQSKTTLINDIVLQTKLLSFNASVEAARAGEHGKGFAVVAEEMGHLAANSGKAAQEINQILEKNLEATKAISEKMQSELTELMNQARKDVTQGIQSGQKGSAAFDKIVSQVESVAASSTEISRATEEQDIGVREITQAIGQLQATSNNLTHVADQTLKAALSLSEQTEAQTKDIRDLGLSLGVSIALPTKPFDFKAAVSAHLDWKMKLSKYLSKPDNSLDPAKVGVDNACALGKWLYGDGQNHSHSSTYAQLKSAHAHFHKTASSIIANINSGHNAEAHKQLSPGGPYVSASDTCVALIKDLQLEVECGQLAESPIVVNKAA